MSVRPFRIGLIVPSSNTVMEPDLHQHIGRAGVVSTTPIFLENVTREAKVRMLEDDLPKAVELIRTTAPDVVVFGCTSAGHSEHWPTMMELAGSSKRELESGP